MHEGIIKRVQTIRHKSALQSNEGHTAFCNSWKLLET